MFERVRTNQLSFLAKRAYTYLSHRGRSIKDACLHAYVRAGFFRRHTATRSCATCADRVLSPLFSPPRCCAGATEHATTLSPSSFICAAQRTATRRPTSLPVAECGAWGMSTWRMRHHIIVPLVHRKRRDRHRAPGSVPRHATPCRRTIAPSSPSFPTRTLH